MDHEKNYRDDLLSRVKSVTELAHESTTHAHQCIHTRALTLFFDNIIKMMDTMTEVKDNDAFVSVSKGLDQLLEEEFFSKIHGSRNGTKRNSRQSNVHQETAASAEKTTSFDIHAHVLGEDDPETLPLNVRLKLAETLRVLGVPEEEIQSQLKLGGN